VGHFPIGIAQSPDGSTVYVANYSDSTISVIDASHNVVAATVGVNFAPWSLGVTRDGKKLYAGSEGSTSVSVMDTSTLAVSSVNVGVPSSGLSVSLGGEVYLGSMSGAIIALSSSTNSVTSTIPSPDAVDVQVEPSPQQATRATIGRLTALFLQGVLNSGQDNSLVTKLQHAITMINSGKTNGAMGNLEGFIGEVNGLYNSGVLSQSEAEALTSTANTVIGQLT
jgi:YVTN family beta-propeller protein